jgi:hypothetical protein
VGEEMLNYNTIEININELNEFVLIKDEPFILKVDVNRVNYEFLINVEVTSEKLIVLGSGAYNPSKVKLPVFQRHAWMNELEGSVIYYNDPTLYLGEINLGWGYGTRERHYLKEMSQILEVLISKFKVTSPLFYGSSAGGFMSMMLAGFLKGRALVNNPQTIVINYYKTHVNNLKKAAYGEGWENQVFLIERINIVEFFKSINYIPEIYYVQNMACEHDVMNHYLPFVKELSSMDENLFVNQIRTEFYKNEEQGHNPLEKEDTLGLIRELNN